MAKLTGSSRDLEYMPWASMVGRCTRPNDTAYPKYGGVGIRLYAGWLGPDGYQAFKAHIGPRPSRKYSIDRINNAGHYEPGNVRWATTAEQMRNRSDNVRLTFNGETLVASDWATKLGISRQSLQKRLRLWPLDRALSTPGRQPPQYKTTPWRYRGVGSRTAGVAKKRAALLDRITPSGRLALQGE